VKENIRPRGGRRTVLEKIVSAQEKNTGEYGVGGYRSGSERPHIHCGRRGGGGGWKVMGRETSTPLSGGKEFFGSLPTKRRARKEAGGKCKSDLESAKKKRGGEIVGTLKGGEKESWAGPAGKKKKSWAACKKRSRISRHRGTPEPRKAHDMLIKKTSERGREISQEGTENPSGGKSHLLFRGEGALKQKKRWGEIKPRKKNAWKRYGKGAQTAGGKRDFRGRALKPHNAKTRRKSRGKKGTRTHFGKGFPFRTSKRMGNKAVAPCK